MSRLTQNDPRPSDPRRPGGYRVSDPGGAGAATSDAGFRLTELRVDGGATADDLRMQIQADVLGTPVVRPVVKETTALGAAYLAGLAVGYWTSRDDIVQNWAADRRFLPGMDGAQRDHLYAGWRRAVARSAGWVLPTPERASVPGLA